MLYSRSRIEKNIAPAHSTYKRNEVCCKGADLNHVAMTSLSRADDYSGLDDLSFSNVSKDSNSAAPDCTLLQSALPNM